MSSTNKAPLYNDIPAHTVFETTSTPTKTVKTTTVVEERQGTPLKYVHPICILRRVFTGHWKRQKTVTITQTEEQLPAGVTMGF